MCDLTTCLKCYAVIMIIVSGYHLIKAIIDGMFSDVPVLVVAIIHAIHLVLHIMLLKGVVSRRRKLLRIFMIYILVHIILVIVIIVLEVMIINKGRHPEQGKQHDDEKDVRTMLYVTTGVSNAVNIIVDLIIYFCVKRYHDACPPGS
ncbi:uncharacterized protein LOC135399000 [Ornithodoros turicata]|uniref:uncharacterized protein LOC135399000 n=1 Tax=Ornithodoros turicata TaxID=34597 RepID=UPI003139FE63